MTYRSSSQATVTAGTTATPGLPAGTQAGDLLIAVYYKRGSTSAPTASSPPPPTGWNFLAGYVNTNINMGVYWAPGTVTDTSWVTTSGEFGVIIHAYSGRSVAAPTAYAGANNSSGTTVSAPAVTAAAGDDLFVAWATRSTLSGSAPAPLTDAQAIDNTNSDMKSAYQDSVSAGSTGTFSTTATVSENKISVTVALPAASAPASASVSVCGVM